MALTIGRWLALLAATVTIIPVLVFSIPDANTWQSSERWRLHRAALYALRRELAAAERLHVERLRDSVRAALPASGPARTIIDARLATPQREALEQLVRDARASLPADARVPTDVVVLLDTAQHEQGVSRPGAPSALARDYLLPRPGIARCAVLVRANPRKALRLRLELRSHETREVFMGPCAFYAAFGLPGARIDEWLTDRGWAFALAGGWSGQASRWSAPSWFSRPREEYDLRELIPVTGFSCLAGRLASCDRAILDAAPRRRPRIVEGHAVSTAEVGLAYDPSSYYAPNTWPLGPNEGSVLADMVRSLGPERFARFWRSDLEPRAAFRDAAAQPIDVWTHAWMERAYFPQRSGPAPGAPRVAGGIILLIIAVGLAIVAARRRQVSA